VLASLLWVGWFGFQRRLRRWKRATARRWPHEHLLATAAAVLAWCAGEALMKARPPMLGAASGAVAGWWPSRRRPATSASSGPVIGACRLRLPVGRQRPEEDARPTTRSTSFGVHGVGGIVGGAADRCLQQQAVRVRPGDDWVTARSQQRRLRPAHDQGPKAVGVTVLCRRCVADRHQDRRHDDRACCVPADRRARGSDISSHGETAYNK